MAKTTDVMETVRRLLAKAEDAATPEPERELAFMQANRLMTRHAIDEAVLRVSQTEQERRKPVIEKWHWMEQWTEFYSYLRSMLSSIAKHNRCRVVIDVREPFTVTVVGMREDVDWVQILYTNCYFTFLSKVSPKWDRNKGEDENIYNMKVAGKKWHEIYVTLATEHLGFNYDDFTWGYSPSSGRIPVIPDWYDGKTYYRDKGLPCEPTVTGYQYLLRAYRRHAKKIGDDNPVGTQRFDAYRRSFAEGFASNIGRRLEAMASEAADEIASSGQEVALRDSWEDIEAAFYAEFPDMHPDEMRKRSLVIQEESKARLRQEREMRDAMLAGMTEKQRVAFLEKEERKLRREQNSNSRWWYEYDHKNRADDSGVHAGRAAAESVSLTRGGTPVNTTSTRKEIDHG